MMDYTIPTPIKVQIEATLQEDARLYAQIQELSASLNAAVTKRTETRGKLDGILVAIAANAGFDMTCEITLSADHTTLTGMAAVAGEAAPSDGEEKTE